MTKEIIIEITDSGELKLETRGFSGKACITETQAIKDLLGSEVSRQLVPAYYTFLNKELKKYLPLCG